MFSKFFVLNSKGETILLRDLRGDSGPLINHGVTDMFFQYVSENKEADPVFTLEGIHFIHTYLRGQGLYFVLTTTHNVSPQFSLEFLARVIVVIKDYCGIVSEEALRKNFTLVYELLNELIDFGYPQETSSEQLRGFIVNSANQTVAGVHTSNFSDTIGGLAPGPMKAISVEHANRPISSTSEKKRSDLFLDVIETLAALFSPSGDVIYSQVVGKITLKNYLQGNPLVQVVLNPDSVISKEKSYREEAMKFAYDGNKIVIDDYILHDIVDTDLFNQQKILQFSPPIGEFDIFQYRIESISSVPFIIYPYFNQISPTKHTLTLKIRALFPDDKIAGKTRCSFSVPSSTSSVYCVTENGSAEYDSNLHIVTWSPGEIKGNSELLLATNVTLTRAFEGDIKKAIGPFSKLLVADTGKAQSHRRWVRTLTVSDSYLRRV